MILAAELKGTAAEKFFSRFSLSDENSLKGLSGAMAAMLLARIAMQPQVTLLVMQSEKRAMELEQQVNVWAKNRSNRVVCFLPERRSIYDQTSASVDVINSRLQAMAMGLRYGGLVISTIRAISERFYQPDRWINSCFTVKVDTDIPRQRVIDKLIVGGYKRSTTVEEQGVFAVRGSLIDVFSPGSENPVRLDFFGDELESIKYFSVKTQRTIDKVKSTLIVPASEFIVEDGLKDNVLNKAQKAMKKMDERRASLLERKLEHFVSRADSRDFRELLPFLVKPTGYMWDYWGDCQIIIEESAHLVEFLDEFALDQEDKYSKESDITPLLSSSSYYHAPEKIIQNLEEKTFVNFSRFGREDNDLLKEVQLHDVPSDPSRETVVTELRQLIEKRWAIGLVIGNETRFHNLKGLLGDRKIAIHSSSQPMGFKYGSILFSRGVSGKGFKDYNSKLAIFSEEDLYMSVAKEDGKQRHATQEQILAISQMVPGDMVVHSDHGVAEFRGVKTMKAGGNTREYLLLKYAGSDKLFVPTDQVHKVSKHIGMDGFSPRIHSLNSKVWSNQKRRVTKNVEAVARELIELYAKRHTAKGFAFNPDCEMQQKMEERFAFVETPDQMKTIIDTKSDMESLAPMDRLICGDVGYGKTEVALRCAFKAICSGKQVALLSPTTLLALQHFQTFQKRLEGLPVTVDMVSRLRKAKEQKETLQKLKTGVLDMLIGTHRLISKDVVFKDLGLLIVDEEQRFGVKHKEKLKKLKEGVDVITLTATPIPRTLQMAMSGIRQISIINTPPQGRLPVQTYVAPFDPSWIKRAIIEELKRGGQVYYVFNRVAQIQEKVAFLKVLVPEARVAVAHGQMSELVVEKTMLSFINHEFDILIATTIIESGLDIPNVNTLIVDRAELLGLSQMYQLRGRVGRSSRQANAYFFYSKGKKLTKEATERLETIEEHTSLGSGFKIALRDLQIRGAGNILGESQSGHIASIGFTLYMEILEEAVASLKSDSGIKRKIDVTIEIPVTAYFPKTYIFDEEIRVELYSRLSRCTELDAVTMIYAECEDRFGQLPDDARKLFDISKLRILAANAHIKKVTKVINHLRFEFASTKRPNAAALIGFDDAVVKQVYFETTDPSAIMLTIKPMQSKTDQIFDLAKSFLEILGQTYISDADDVECIEEPYKKLKGIDTGKF